MSGFGNYAATYLSGVMTQAVGCTGTRARLGQRVVTTD